MNNLRMWYMIYLGIGVISYYLIYLGLMSLNIIHYGVFNPNSRFLFYGFIPSPNLSFLFIIFGGVGIYGIYYHYSMMKRLYKKR